MKTNNPPAFPTEHSAGIYSGMTLRDYFAGQAIGGMLARLGYPDDVYNKETIVRHAYEYADAMLAERMKYEN